MVPGTADPESPTDAPVSGGTAVEPFRVLIVKYTLAVLFVVVVGVGAWWVNEGRFRTPNIHGFSAALEALGEPNHYYLIQFFGWSSAVLFVSAFSGIFFTYAH